LRGLQKATKNLIPYLDLVNNVKQKPPWQRAKSFQLFDERP